MTSYKTIKKAKETISKALSLANITHSKVTTDVSGFGLKVSVYD